MVVGVNNPIVVVGDAPPIEYCTLAEGEPVAELICETMLKASTVNVVEASPLRLKRFKSAELLNESVPALIAR